LKQGKFDNKPAPIAEWKNDARKKITTNDLLHMNSGLAGRRVMIKYVMLPKCYFSG
jgi:CubicO group peptidase (beta-lactamase class C family)